VLKQPRLARLRWLLVLGLCGSAACSRSSAPEQLLDDAPASTGARGNDASIRRIQAAAHALAQPERTVDYVAAEMEGVITAQTKNRALIHYDGYRATFTTPSNYVTRVTFVLTEARPSVQQLTDAFGKPKEHPKGVLYEYQSAATGATIRILAEPVSMPPDEGSLIRRVVVEGAPSR